MKMNSSLDVKTSFINDGNFSRSSEEKTFCDLAICDLHVHLDGALSSEAIIKVAKEENIKLPTFNNDELKKYLEVEENCKSLNEFLKKFKIPLLAMQSKFALQEVTNDLLSRLAKQGIKYVEIRMSPYLSTKEGLSQEEVVEALLEVINNSFKNYSIKSNLILCLMRGAKKEYNIKTIEVAKKYLNKGVVAIDLAGAEALYPNILYKEEFEYAKSLNIPYIIHAGEADGYESIEAALDMGALRIGHGIRSLENEDTIKRLATLKTPLEICPKSNLDTKAVNSLKDLRINELMNKGVIITLNTDDQTTSNTNLKAQYEILYKLGFSYEEAKQIAINTINSAFLSNKEKEELRKLLD